MRLKHTTRPGESLPRCDPEAEGEAIPIEEVLDPDAPAVFTCGACWLDISGVEPMGGSLLLSEAHLGMRS